MYYKDDFNVTFEEESAFYKYLDDVEKRAEWFRAQSKDLTVEAVTKDSTCTPIGNINLEYLKEDTINNSGLLIKTPDRSCFLGISDRRKGACRIRQRNTCLYPEQMSEGLQGKIPAPLL